jgi:hypothetical protein
MALPCPQPPISANGQETELLESDLSPRILGLLGKAISNKICPGFPLDEHPA